MWIVAFSQALEMCTRTVEEFVDDKIEEMRQALEEFAQYEEAHMYVPEVAGFKVKERCFEQKFNLPKQTYFPKVRAIARSTC